MRSAKKWITTAGSVGSARGPESTLSGSADGASSAAFFTAASASNDSWYTDSARSSGRKGAIPRAAISLAPEGEATSFCTAGERPSSGSGATIGAAEGSGAVSFMEDLQPAQGDEVVAVLDGGGLPGH